MHERSIFENEQHSAQENKIKEKNMIKKELTLDSIQKKNKVKANKNETLLSKETNIRKTKASGATEKEKGDLSNEHFVIENKMTNKDFITIEKKWFSDVSKEANKKSKEPIIILSFEKKNNLPPTHYVLIKTLSPENDATTKMIRESMKIYQKFIDKKFYIEINNEVWTNISFEDFSKAINHK